MPILPPKAQSCATPCSMSSTSSQYHDRLIGIVARTVVAGARDQGAGIVRSATRQASAAGATHTLSSLPSGAETQPEPVTMTRGREIQHGQSLRWLCGEANLRGASAPFVGPKTRWRSSRTHDGPSMSRGHADLIARSCGNAAARTPSASPRQADKLR